MKKLVKVISICLVFIMMFMITTSLGATTIEGVLSDTDKDGKITEQRAGELTSIDDGTASMILGFIQFIGYAVAIGMLIYIGIKYTMSAADERATLKGALVKYVIGAILIVAASSVVGMIYNFSNSF